MSLKLFLANETLFQLILFSYFSDILSSKVDFMLF